MDEAGDQSFTPRATAQAHGASVRSGCRRTAKPRVHAWPGRTRVPDGGTNAVAMPPPRSRLHLLAWRDALQLNQTCFLPSQGWRSPRSRCDAAVLRVPSLLSAMLGARLLNQRSQHSHFLQIAAHILSGLGTCRDPSNPGRAKQRRCRGAGQRQSSRSHRLSVGSRPCPCSCARRERYCIRFGCDKRSCGARLGNVCSKREYGLR
jgi:hypothetical protein